MLSSSLPELTMPKRNVGVSSVADPDEYSKILDAFNKYDTRKEPVAKSEQTSRRASTSIIKAVSPSVHDARRDGKTAHGSRRGSMPAVTKNGVAPKTHLNEAPKKEDSSITFYSSTSNSDVDDAPVRFDNEQGVVPLAGFTGYEKNLEKENERLRKLVLEYERQLAEIARTENAIIGTTEINEDEPLSSKRLKGKIQSLKAKRRDEKIRCMQLQKSVETHSAEIEGLQRELNRSLNDLDQLHKDRIQDKSQLAKLGKQLGEAAHRLKQLVARESGQEKQINSLEEVVQKQNQELEVTLNLLQSKVERIIQLEYELDLRKGNAQDGFDAMMRQTTHVSEKDIKDSQDEIKKLRRQNMMLKLLVEELEEHHKREDNESDIDSVFLKFPQDPRPRSLSSLPFSVGLHSLDIGGEGRSIDTDIFSVDTDGAVPFIEGYGKNHGNFLCSDDENYHDSEPSSMNYNGSLKRTDNGLGKEERI